MKENEGIAPLVKIIHINCLKETEIFYYRYTMGHACNGVCE